MNVFNLTDEDCSRAMDEFVEAKEAGEKKQNWVATCWQIITTSLHDDVYRKISQSPRVASKRIFLHPLFQQLQVVFACPGAMPKSFDEAVALEPGPDAAGDGRPRGEERTAVG